MQIKEQPGRDVYATFFKAGLRSPDPAALAVMLGMEITDWPVEPDNAEYLPGLTSLAKATITMHRRVTLLGNADCIEAFAKCAWQIPRGKGTHPNVARFRKMIDSHTWDDFDAAVQSMLMALKTDTRRFSPASVYDLIAARAQWAANGKDPLSSASNEDQWPANAALTYYDHLPKKKPE